VRLCRPFFREQCHGSALASVKFDGVNAIHPFADGNGRVGRTLLNYFLMTHNHPPLVVYDEDKAGYYQALQSYDKDEKIAPLLAFLREQVKKTWEKTLMMTQTDTSAATGISG
jgi:Fic family protein